MQKGYRNMQIKYSAFVQKLKETKHCYAGSPVPAHLTQDFPISNYFTLLYRLVFSPHLPFHPSLLPHLIL